MSGTLPWYVARASGLVAWGLLTASVIWGLLMTSKAVRRWTKNSWLLDLHRWLAGLAVVFTGVHIVAILGDSYVHFGLASVLVPLASHWHPVAVAWGVASIYLLAAVELTSLLRRHISRVLWRRAHFLSFPLFVFSTAHGLSAGTDGRRPMVLIAAGLAVGAVGALTTARFAARAPERRTGPSTGRPRVPSVRPGGPAATGSPAPKPPVPVG